MQDLIDKTHSLHYELYRRSKLEQMGFSDGGADNQPHSLQETYEQRREEYLKNIHTREEQMRHTFVQKVKDKEAELKASEQEVSWKNVKEHAQCGEGRRGGGEEKGEGEEGRRRGRGGGCEWDSIQSKWMHCFTFNQFVRSIVFTFCSVAPRQV